MATAIPVADMAAGVAMAEIGRIFSLRKSREKTGLGHVTPPKIVKNPR